MRLLKRLEPRQFNFRPRYYKPVGEEVEEGIKFSRKTLYDPHSLVRGQWSYISLAVLIAIIILILGGIRPSMSPPTLTLDDLAGNQIVESNK